MIKIHKIVWRFLYSTSIVLSALISLENSKHSYAHTHIYMYILCTNSLLTIIFCCCCHILSVILHVIYVYFPLFVCAAYFRFICYADAHKYTRTHIHTHTHAMQCPQLELSLWRWFLSDLHSQQRIKWRQAAYDTDTRWLRQSTDLNGQRSALVVVAVVNAKMMLVMVWVMLRWFGWERTGNVGKKECWKRMLHLICKVLKQKFLRSEKLSREKIYKNRFFFLLYLIFIF